MIRKIAKLFAISLLVLLVADIVFWQVSDRMKPGPEPDGITRAIQDTQTDWTISYLTPSIREPDQQRLIYVHGTPGDADAFKNYLLDPVTGFESISIDRPGFGQTTPMKPALTLEEQASVLEPFLVEQSGAWPVLVGHSLGGPIIAQVAAMYPEKVGGLVILAGSLSPEHEEWFWYNRIIDWRVTSILIPRMLRNSNRELKPMREELKKLEPLLKKVTCPVIILHAPNDMLVPWGNVAFMESAFAEGTIQEVVKLDDRNHFLPWNSEQEVREAIISMGGTPKEES